MSQRPRIIIAQQQRLALNTSLSAAIRVLRFDAAGLTRYLEEQAAENPHIRLIGPEAPAIGDWLPRWSGVLAFGTRGAPTLAEPAAPQPGLIAHVMAEIGAMGLDRPQRAIALSLVEALEPSGWLGRAPEAVARDLGREVGEVEAVLTRLQEMEPPGLFARNLAECLALQARELGLLDREMQILLENLDLLAAGDVQRLSRLCGCDGDAIARHFRIIRGLNPKPGAGFSAANPAALREPDLLARPLKDGRWQVGLNRSSLPDVEVAANGAGDAAALGAARALSHMIKARNATLLRVGREIVARQQAALVQGAGALQPMRMADLAEALGLHVSTISRVVAGVAIDAPAGVLWLRQMFSGARQAEGGDPQAPGLSAAALRHRLGRIIAAETRSRPLSDAALVERLADETGVRLARRTIAQYREAEGIPPAHRRRLRPAPARKPPKG